MHSVPPVIRRARRCSLVVRSWLVFAIIVPFQVCPAALATPAAPGSAVTSCRSMARAQEGTTRPTALPSCCIPGHRVFCAVPSMPGGHGVTPVSLAVVILPPVRPVIGIHLAPRGIRAPPGASVRDLPTGVPPYVRHGRFLI